MMLHRHFETEKAKNITTLADVTPGAKKEFVSDVFKPDDGGEKPDEGGERAVRRRRKTGE